MTPKAIIFDMDGVILDSETICDKTWAITQKEMGVTTDKDYLNMCRGTNHNDTLQILHDVFGADFDAEKFLQRSIELFHQIEEKDGIPLMPYVRETLEYLSKRYTLALASSTNGGAVKRQLTNAGVIDYFKTRTTGEQVVHSKPDPEIYLIACRSIGLEPSECVAVEDSPNGIRSAHAAGIPVIMVPDKIKPTAELKSLCWKVCPSLKSLAEFL